MITKLLKRRSRGDALLGSKIAARGEAIKKHARALLSAAAKQIDIFRRISAVLRPNPHSEENFSVEKYCGTRFAFRRA